MKHLLTILIFFITISYADKPCSPIGDYYGFEKILEKEIQIALHVELLAKDIAFYKLKVLIKNSLKNGTKFTIITQELSRDIIELVKYKNVDYYILDKNITLNYSQLNFKDVSLHVDNSLTIQEHNSLLHYSKCTDTTNTFNFYLNHSSAYLK